MHAYLAVVWGNGSRTPEHPANGVVGLKKTKGENAMKIQEKSCNYLKLFVITSIVLPIFAPAALAQDEDTGGLLDVVTVTAQKREENVQDVPISMSVVSPEEIYTITAGVPDIRFLNGRVANLGVESSFGRVFPRFYIRGYGNTDFDINASQPVSLVMDEIVQENAILKGFPVFDVERIEVLRGPQGTLFGRNTPAGVVKIDSVKPSEETSAYFRGSYGSFNATHLEGAYGTGFGNGWSTRLSAIYLHQGDNVDNGFTGEDDAYGGFDEYAARFQLAYDNGGSFSGLFNLHYRNVDGTAILFRANIIEQGTNDLNDDNYDRDTVYFDGQNGQDLDEFGGMMKLEWDIGDVTLTSITGYETVELFSVGDIDGGYGCGFCGLPNGPGFVPFAAETADGLNGHSQWTEEIRLSSDTSGEFDWILGFFYFDESFDIDTINYNTVFGGGVNGLVLQGQDTKSWAFFAHADFDVSDDFVLGAGIRYSDDQKDYFAERFLHPDGIGGLGPIYVNTDDSRVTWDLSGTYAMSDDANFYARIATGFRAPSIQGRILFGNTVSVADSETSISYEFGVKATVADGRARFGANVFTYTVDDAQLTAVGGAANFNQIINANKVEGSGIELDGEAYLTPELLLSYSIGYVQTEIKDDTLSVAPCNPWVGCTVLDPGGITPGSVLIDGNPLPQSPKLTSSLIANWRHPVENGAVYATADWVYRSEMNFVLYEAVEYRGEALSEVGLRVGYSFGEGNHDVSLFGRNIFDTTKNIYTIDFNNLLGVVNEPRTFGIEYNYTYQ
jgi:iron complex outermembrane recepter protein